MSEPAAVRETHIGVVFFVGDRAYKLKKPVNLGFLDFGTREQRLAACLREVELNRRLAPDVYLGVATVSDVDGRPADHLVVMRRMPDERRLSALVRAGVPLAAEVIRLARVLAAFHAGAERGPHVDAEATRDALATRWEDSFAQVDDVGEAVLAPEVRAETKHRVREFLAGRAPLFAARVADGRIVDGHGDLLADDIFLLDDGPRVLDCLEFDDRLRRLDALDDVAFLAMDLTRLGAPELAALLLDTHAEHTADPAPAALRAHYLAYRAFVRVKVACLRHAQGDAAAGEEARSYADLALRELRTGEVRMLLVGGLPGTGKSTLAGHLADELGAVLLSTDRIRKELAGRDPLSSAAAPYRTGIYAPEHTARTYAELLRRAEELLGRGESVVLDASWSAEVDHERARQVAARTHSTYVPLRCAAPARVADHRLAVRTGSPSDATATIAHAMAADVSPWPDAVVVDTSGTPAAALDAALRVVAPARPKVPASEVRSPDSAGPAAGDDPGMTTTRRQFHERLDGLLGGLNEMVGQVEAAMRAATTALFEADVDLAETAIGAYAAIESEQVTVDEIAIDLLAREQPVATDLRTLIACLRMSADLRRMGKLAMHVAEVARRHHPESALPGVVWSTMRSMSGHVLALMAVTTRAVSELDNTAVVEIEQDENRVDDLCAQVYQGLFRASGGLGVEATVTAALVARYYERYADHALELAHRVAFLTGHSGLDE